jgi:hypothetical protein
VSLKFTPRPKKFRLQESKIKTMLITFFCKQLLIHREFVPEEQTVTISFYVKVIERLLERIRRMKPQFRAEVCWFLLHYNAPAHSALVVKRFVAKHSVVEIGHPHILLISCQRIIFSFLQ